MKKIRYILGIALGLLMFSACENYAEFETEVPYNPVVTPLRGAWAQDGDGTMLEAMVDQEAKLVKIKLHKVPDLSKVIVKLDVPKRCELVSPAEPESFMDLTKEGQVIIRANDQEYVYTVVAKLVPTFSDFSVKGVKPYRCDNDCREAWNDKPNIQFQHMIDGKFMSAPGAYGEIGWQSYQVTKCADPKSEDFKNNWATITLDLGEEIYLQRVTLHPYWHMGSGPYPVIKYDVYTYVGTTPQPSKTGDWKEWKKVGSFDYNKTPTVWPKGDSVVLEYGDSPKSRYYRIRFTENWETTHPESSWGVPGTYATAELQIGRYDIK